ncbi:MAG TPA: RICIN domain-containing protein [Bryobacteraceae bacterium]|nr:RICIN domain-containing protein [Bryobacteraceae bacterium]
MRYLIAQKFTRSHLSVLAAGLLCSTAWGQVSVLTQHNDNSRSGNNLKETILTTSNVNVNSFGKLFTVNLDGYVFAQPLYVPSLPIAGGTHNVVYVATAGDSIFAIDADLGTQLWTKNYGTPVPSSVINTQNILVQVGIISTPVIDPSTQTMYFVTKTYENQVQIFRLHAIDIIAGSEKFGGPVEIAASVPGTGDASSGGQVPFQAAQENQRAALTLANGVVYLTFASHEDYNPYHGWVLGYSASTLQQLYVFNDTPNGSEGGIWQSGQGLVVDAANNLYLMVGNGTTDVQTGGRDYGEAFIKLNSSLVPQDYFIPNNFDALNSADKDVSSGGPVLIPGTNYIVGEGKQGLMYVVNTTNMGHYNASRDPVVQEFSTAGGLWGAPVFFNYPTNPTLFVWDSGSNLEAYSFTNGLFNTTPAAEGATSISGCCAGGALSISSNNYAPGTNIIWASVSLTSPIHSLAAGQLFAYDATNITTELWDSYQNQSRDDFGDWAKFVAPTVANGKVYVGSDSGSGQLVAYGLLPVSQTVSTIDDAVAGAGGNKFEYIGNGWQHCSNCGSNLYDGTNSWDNATNDYVTVAFTGTQIKFYGVQDVLHGIGAVSIDGGSETNVDFYASTRAGDVLLWTSPTLTAGDHVFKLRVTGNKNPSSTNYYAVPDRVDILSGGSGPAAPTGLTATGQSNSILLSWTASASAQYYNVYRGTSPGAEAETPVGTPTSTTYTDTNVNTGTTYYYTVAAVGSAGTSAPSNEASAVVGAVLENGTYTVSNSAATLVWDDPAFSSSLGTNVELYQANGGANQKWTFTSVGNGYYTITNDSNGLVLDDPGFNTASGTKLVQWSLNGGNNQHWLVTSSGSGFVISNQYSGLAVDASADTQKTDIVQATATGSTNQLWSIH